MAMNWRGKAIGGSIGSMFGPLGALAGAAAGHFFVDRKTPDAKKQALRLLAVTAGALYELASADGRYTKREDRAIRSVLDEVNHALGTALPPHELAYLIDDASRIDRCLQRLAAMVRQEPPLARASMVWLWRVAVSDGDETPPEYTCLAHYAHAAGLTEEVAQQAALLYRRATVSASDQKRREACSTLGVPYQADTDQIRRAYRTMSQKYHPDKHAGLDPDIRALTAEKFSQIKTAYDTLCGQTALTGDWYAKVGRGQLVPAAPDTSVHCFLCNHASRLPSEKIGSARCPVCQCLLALDRGLAEQLLS